MRFSAHLSFGIFSGLLIYSLTENIIYSFLVFIIQIALILDFILNKLIKKEPFHSILGMLAVSLIFFLFDMMYGIMVFIGYFTHLFLDLFVDEKIELFFPFSKRLIQYPFKYSEEYVIYGSLLLSLLLIILMYLGFLQL